MKKLLLILLLTIFSNGAMAEWTLISIDDAFDVYVDIASKLKSGKKVKIWTLQDYKSPQTDSSERLYLSALIQREFDCFNETITILSFALYTENMQSGSAINTYTFQPAKTTNEPIVPNSMGESVFKIACDKK
jgi:hypothetical protein